MPQTLYARWDEEHQMVIGSLSYSPGPEDDWVRCSHPGRRKSQAQELEWSMEDHEDGGHILVGSWVGPENPGDCPAPPEEINRTWRELMQYPVAANDGLLFDFDRESREIMRGTIVALTVTEGVESWRLHDNSTVSVNSADLQEYYDQLEVNQAIRGMTLNQEYVAFRTNGATRNDLKAWCKSYSPGE